MKYECDHRKLQWKKAVCLYALANSDMQAKTVLAIFLLHGSLGNMMQWLNKETKTCLIVCLLAFVSSTDFSPTLCSPIQLIYSQLERIFNVMGQITMVLVNNV